MRVNETFLQDAPDLTDRMNNAAHKRRGEVQALLYAGVLRIEIERCRAEKAERGLAMVQYSLEELAYRIRCYQIGDQAARDEVLKRENDRRELVAYRMKYGGIEANYDEE